MTVNCSIVRGEILFGIEKLPAGKRRQHLEQKAEELFRAIICEPVSLNAADHYARIKSLREKAGRPLAENDAWIAATVLSLNATLATRDMAHPIKPATATKFGTRPDWATKWHKNHKKSSFCAFCAFSWQIASALQFFPDGP